MGHYDEEYEEMYDRHYKAKQNREQERVQKLVSKGYSYKEVTSFLDMAKEFGLHQ